MPSRVLPLLLALVVPVAGAVLAADGDESPAVSTTLTAACWSGSAYSHGTEGDLCWLSGTDRSLRLEVREIAGGNPAVDSPPETDPLQGLEPLLTRTGNGWTLVLGPDDSGTLNAWGREWRPVPRGLAQLVRLVTAAVELHPDGRPEFGFASPAGPSPDRRGIPRPPVVGRKFAGDRFAARWSYQLSPLDPDVPEVPEDPENGRLEAGTDFRGRMTARGRGTGGNGEIVSLDWIPVPGTGEFGLVITSSRRPGTLRMEPPREIAVTAPDPEAFLPLWPLSQFLESR